MLYIIKNGLQGMQTVKNKVKLVGACIVAVLSLLSTDSFGAAMAARMSRINKKFLQDAPYVQGGQKTFWLKTGGDSQEWALIALNNPHKSNSPRINPDTYEANFHYVTDYFYKSTNTYASLPAGLYFWRSGKAGSIKVRPSDGIQYESDLGLKCYAKVGAKKAQCFDATRNPFALGKGSEQRIATKAYNRAGGDIPLHPFDDDRWADMITIGAGAKAPGLPGKPIAGGFPVGGGFGQGGAHHGGLGHGGHGAKPGKPAVGAALPAGVTISVASSNVMSQGQYEHDFPRKAAGNQLDLKTRTGYFHGAFADDNQLAGKDFVMLQEFGWGMKDKDTRLEKLDKKPHLVRSLKFSIAKTPYTSTAKQANQKGIVDLLFDGKKYELLEAFGDRNRKEGEGRYLGGVFEFKKHPGLKVGVVSAHIQTYKPEQVGELAAEIERADKKYGDIAGWIVAGDYNINYNSPDHGQGAGLSHMTGAGFESVSVGEVAGKGGKRLRFTALGKKPVTPGDPNTEWLVTPEGIDYIWYRGGLRPLGDGEVFPAVGDQDNQLLTGGHLRNGVNSDDSGRRFYSDHAIVSAEFELAQGAGAQAGGGAAQVGGGAAVHGGGAAAQAVAVCPACTYHNPADAVVCEICGSKLDKAKVPIHQKPQVPLGGGAVKPQKPVAGKQFRMFKVCPACTMHNNIMAPKYIMTQKCEVCNTDLRGVSAEIESDYEEVPIVLFKD